MELMYQTLLRAVLDAELTRKTRVHQNLMILRCNLTKAIITKIDEGVEELTSKIRKILLENNFQGSVLKRGQRKEFDYLLL